jgi:hypothetical protein
MADKQKYAEWIVANRSKKGTSEFETVAQAYRAAQAPAEPQAKEGFVNSVNRTLMGVPGVPQLAEFASGANRAIIGALDTVPKAANEVLALAGSERRVPTIRGTTGNEVGGPRGQFVGEGLQADILGAAGETAAMAVGSGALLRGAANALPAATAGESAATGVMRTMGGSTAAQDVVGGVLSGAGAEVGREVGGDTGALIGAVAAPAIPTLARAAGAEVLRRAFRGGEQGRQALASAVDDASRAGTSLTVGQATGSRPIQAAENISSRVAGGGPITSAAQRSADDIQARLSGIADDISQTRGAEAAGRAINTAIKGRNGFIDRFQAQSGQLWNGVDDAIGRETPVAIQNTKTTLNDLVRTDTLGKILTTAKTAEIKQALDSVDTIDYGSLRELRTLIGAKISNSDLISDVPRAELRRLYGSITDDIRAAAQASGDDAARAFTRANNYTRSGHTRIDGFIENVMRKADFTKVYEAVTKGGEGAQTINAFKRSMEPEEWEIVASNVVRQLGKANPGQQGADGIEFSVSKFLTDWNRLGPAKRALFSGSRTLDHYGRDLESIARTAERIKTAAAVGANPSGTGQFTANLSASVAAGGAVATGNAPVFAGVLAALAANNGFARLMSSPRFVNWLAGTTKANSQQMTAQMAKLVAIQQSMGSEEARDVNALVQALEPNQQEQPVNNAVADRPAR